MSVTIYHNPRCGSSRKTLALLEERGLKPKIVLYLETSPDADEIKALLKKLKFTAHDLVRKKEAAPLGIDVDSLTEAQLITAMAKNPILIQRPVVINGAKAVIARPPETALGIL